MDLEVLVDNKNGKVWDMSDVVSDLEWQTTRIGKAGSLSFTLIDDPFSDKNMTVNNGDIVRVRLDKSNVFYGYVFELSYGVDEGVKIKAYDQIRYLMANDTYVFAGKTATDIVRKIATDAGLKLGALVD